MLSANGPEKELLGEIDNLRLRLEEAEETLRAIGAGEVDAFVVSGPAGKQVYTLRGAEHLYRVLVETMNEGAATLAPDGTILFGNNRLATMLQVPLENLIGTQLTSYVAPADQPFFTARLSRCSTEPTQDEMVLITGKGKAIPVLISCAVLDLPDMQVTSVVITDITLQKRNEEYKAAEKLARSIIDQAGEVIVVCDERGRIIRASKMAHELCGQNPLLKRFERVIPLRETATGKPVALDLSSLPREYKNIEVALGGPDARIVYFVLNVSPLQLGSEQSIGFIATLTDITEKKKIRDQLLAMNEELERRVAQRTHELQEKHLQYLHAEKLAAMGQLSASIAHEFGNPLQGIMSILKGMKKSLTMDEEDEAMLDTAISESERMKNLIRNLQEFNRPSLDRKVKMAVNPAIDSLLLLCKADFKRKKIRTELHYADDLPEIMAIPDQVKQVFLNLLTNAADACVDGGVITVRTWRAEKRVAVAIEDNGTGIEPGKLEVIFQPFYTTKAEDQKGTGLGLSVCQGIIQKHHGEISVTSEPGKGSTFTVLFPIL